MKSSSGVLGQGILIGCICTYGLTFNRISSLKEFVDSEGAEGNNDSFSSDSFGWTLVEHKQYRKWPNKTIQEIEKEHCKTPINTNTVYATPLTNFSM